MGIIKHGKYFDPNSPMARYDKEATVLEIRSWLEFVNWKVEQYTKLQEQLTKQLKEMQE